MKFALVPSVDEPSDRMWNRAFDKVITLGPALILVADHLTAELVGCHLPQNRFLLKVPSEDQVVVVREKAPIRRKKKKKRRKEEGEDRYLYPQPAR